ncbi:MAG: cysteine desulfurase NifS [Dehalococcoidia bacterium]|nr:cysteine desulfurase NifS [Dehalococcoidia bacterium]
MKRVYMDYAATTPVMPQVLEAMAPYFHDKFGNASSVHSMGEEGRDAVEKARGQIASLINSQPKSVIFTGCGTESNNHAIKGVALANRKKGNHIITTAIEHHAVLNTCKFLRSLDFDVTILPVDKFGMVDPGDVKKAITGKTLLVSIMHANNEVGTIQPIEEIGKITREAGVYFHVDTVQTFGHLPLDVGNLEIDLLSASAHKLYGPKGVGMLYIRPGTAIVPLLHGGEQEEGRRAGTENVAGIAGFGRAAGIAQQDMQKEVDALTGYRDRLIETILAEVGNTYLNGHPLSRLPNNVNFSFDFIEGEAILMYLDAEGICASTGSACSSASSEASHVLTAMGIPVERARGSLRFSMGRWTTQEDVDRVIESLPRITGKLREMSPLVKEKCGWINYL